MEPLQSRDLRYLGDICGLLKLPVTLISNVKEMLVYNLVTQAAQVSFVLPVHGARVTHGKLPHSHSLNPLHAKAVCDETVTG